MRLAIFVNSKSNPAVMRTAMAKWSICAFEDDGTLISKRDGVVIIPKATCKRASLVALRDALKRFNKAAVIKIYVSDPFVRNMLQTNMPHRWSQHDWRLFRYGRDIKYVELWQEINTLLSSHAVNYAGPAELAENKIIKQMEVS